MFGLELTTLLAFALASFALVIVPGPTVTVIIANSLKHGARAGLWNIAGTQLGLLIIIGVLAAGLELIVSRLGLVFEVLRWVGAGYLIYLGIKLWRADGTLGEGAAGPARSNSAYFWQGFIVILSNPKLLVFFGAFIPQFVNPTGNTAVQTIVLGCIFCIIATIFDAAYALFAGRAGAMISKSRVRLIERLSGTALIGGGVWLALSNSSKA